MSKEFKCNRCGNMFKPNEISRIRCPDCKSNIKYPKGGDAGKKIFNGYAGIFHTAEGVANTFPDLKGKIYVEPFAGLSRVEPHFKKQNQKPDLIVLNDMSEYAVGILREQYKKEIEEGTVKVEQCDFKACIEKYDSKDTFFLVDPPWDIRTYTVNSLPFCDRKVSEYYTQVINLMHSIKGEMTVCSPAYSCTPVNKFLKLGFTQNTITSKLDVIFGAKARTALWSNKDPLFEGFLN